MIDWSWFLIGYLCGFLTLVPVVLYIVHALGKMVSWFR